MKKKYLVSLSAEEALEGFIELTDEEYEIVNRATNPVNWENLTGGGYCGSFYIEPIENDNE